MPEMWQQDDRQVLRKLTPVSSRPEPAVATPRVVWLVPLLALTALPLILLRFGTASISDPDTLWHILAGRQLWETWQFAGPDRLATFTQLPFVYHQWLPELAMAAMDSWAGLPAVAWLFHLMLVAFFLAIYALCRSRAGVLAGLLASVGAWLGASGSLSPRPQVVGFVLLAVSLLLWLRTERDGRLRWWLNPLAWLWACVHGSWLYALGLAVVFGVGMLLDGRWPLRVAARAALLIGGVVVVAMLTPVGPALYLTPLAVARVSPFIMEWKPAPITEPSALVTLAMGLFVLVAWLRSSRRMSWTRLLLWVFAMCSALLYARTIAIGAILVAPLFAEALERALPERATPVRWERGVLGAAALTSIVVAALLVPSTAATAGKVPAAFDGPLAALPNGTVVWNVDALGGWLLYAHPNVRPTMDTRAEVYGPDYLRSYVRAISGYPGWEETVEGTGARYAIVDEDGPLADGLVRQKEWSVVSKAENYALLRAP
jgi:hypothetical protein